MDTFVVGFNDQAQEEHRSFWGGPLGTVILVAPGVVITLLGVWLTIAYGEGASIVLGILIILSGVYGTYVGIDHRRREMQKHESAPVAFALSPDSVFFPRNHHLGWNEVRFILTEEEPARILCSPVGLAYRVDRLDHSVEEIEAGIADWSDGRCVLERH